MPRAPRIKSQSRIYHIIMRGINRQTLFEDEEDHTRFIQTLQRYRAICEYKLYAYCLMSNHVHLLMMEDKEPLETVMRMICGSYVLWYNKKYDRIGYLFQDRFKSEPVEDDTYFLTRGNKKLTLFEDLQIKLADIWNRIKCKKDTVCVFLCEKIFIKYILQTFNMILT